MGSLLLPLCPPALQEKKKSKRILIHSILIKAALQSRYGYAN